jgi:hypothetical protein
VSQTIVSPEFGNSTTDRLASMAHETIDRVTPHANRTEHDVRSAAAKAGESVKLMQEHAVEVAERNLRKVRLYAENNPLVTAGIAFAAGVLLSALARR